MIAFSSEGAIAITRDADFCTKTLNNILLLRAYRVGPTVCVARSTIIRVTLWHARLNTLKYHTINITIGIVRKQKRTIVKSFVSEIICIFYLCCVPSHASQHNISTYK